MNLLSLEPDYGLDAFLVPPPIVEFFDAVKKSTSRRSRSRERRQDLAEQQRLADEGETAAARGGAGPHRPAEQDRAGRAAGVPLQLVAVRRRAVPERRAGETAIAAGQLVLGLVNVAAIVVHNQIADDTFADLRLRRVGVLAAALQRLGPADLDQVNIVKYASAGLFWALYGYGVWDAHRNFVPHRDRDHPRPAWRRGGSPGTHEDPVATLIVKSPTAASASGAREADHQRRPRSGERRRGAGPALPRTALHIHFDGKDYNAAATKPPTCR